MLDQRAMNSTKYKKLMTNRLCSTVEVVFWKEVAFFNKILLSNTAKIV